MGMVYENKDHRIGDIELNGLESVCSITGRKYVDDNINFIENVVVVFW